MLRTRVGYAGGKTDKPTYRSIGDHTEAVQVEFDPEQISYEQLLDVFWDSHHAFGRSWSTQYKDVLWTHGEGQARAARKSVEALTKKHGKTPTTEVAVATTFWIAEDYHQKYSLRANTELLEALLGEDASDEKIRESTVTARANGWIGGHGTPEEIASESKALGLDEKARKALASALGKRAPAECR